MTAFWDFPAETFETGVEFWVEATDADLSEPRGPGGEFATLIPTEGDACLRVQRVRSGKGGNHLDLHVDDVAAAAERATALGASVVAEEQGEVTVLSSPGGFPFCLVAHHGESRVPSPVEWPGGQRSIADQICIDIPWVGYERERDFWKAFTGRRGLPSRRPEFERLERPRGMPLEILLQRREEVGVGEPVTAHIDLACSDVEAETVRHNELGAVPVERFEHWQVMRDPAGLEYCITSRVPEPAA